MYGLFYAVVFLIGYIVGTGISLYTASVDISEPDRLLFQHRSAELITPPVAVFAAVQSSLAATQLSCHDCPKTNLTTVGKNTFRARIFCVPNC